MALIKIKTPNADIAKNYKRNFMISVAATLILLIIIFRVQFNPEAGMQVEEVEREVIQMEDIIQTEQEHQPPPPERPRTPEVVPDDQIVEDEIFDFEGDIDDGPGDLPPPPPPPEEEEEEEELEYFEVVEDMPEIIGGMDALYDVLEYPEMARRAGVEGTVAVRFIVDEQGNVINPEIMRGVGAGLDEAALNAVQQVSFNPGRQRGRPVPVRFTIQIRFQLDR